MNDGSDSTTAVIADPASSATVATMRRSRRVVDRGLSTDHPSYNPLAYHLGTVWPVENATFLLGLRRYGLDEHADRLVTALFGAASFFTATRLPETISGD